MTALSQDRTQAQPQGLTPSLPHSSPYTASIPKAGARLSQGLLHPATPHCAAPSLTHKRSCARTHTYTCSHTQTYKWALTPSLEPSHPWLYKVASIIRGQERVGRGRKGGWSCGAEGAWGRWGTITRLPWGRRACWMDLGRDLGTK